MDPTGPQDRAKALEQATSALLKPLQPAASGSNAPFRREYVRLLMANLEPLLDKQLHSRTFAMLVLARAGDPQVAKLLYDQIADPKQVLVVKLIAASGLSALAQSNRSPVEAAVAMPASRSLSEFLRNEREAFYPAHIRALEALGWMRLATGNQSAGRAELAETALIYLFDPDAKPEVRSYAAWALGMLQVPSSVRDYNFALIAYGMGRLALEIGQKAVKVPLPVGGATDSVKKANNAERDRNFHQITRACDMLLRILASLEGDAQIRDFGLLRSGHANLSSARPYVTEISSRVRNVTEAAYALSQSAGALIERNRVALETAVNELAAFLAQKQPPDNKLYRGGEEMALGAGARARGTGAARAGEPGER
jgi:hypothetical protein